VDDMNAVIRLGTMMAALFAAVFGRWSAPPWAPWLGGRLRAGASSTHTALRARPQAFAAGALALVLLAVGGHYGRLWWKARPQPVEVSYKVVNPAITDFANNGAPHSLVVTFSKSVAPLALVGKEITTGIAATPPVEGQWRWASDRQLEFTPKAEWPIGAEYAVQINREAIAPQV
jgi:alpha-2-macroglobulin